LLGITEFEQLATIQRAPKFVGW